MHIPSRFSCFVSALILAAAALPASERAFLDALPEYLRDRGTGVAASHLGTYVHEGQWLVLTSHEYERNRSARYNGSDLGFEDEVDYLGTSTEHQAKVYLAYGLTDDVAVEVEGNAFRRQTLKRAPEDESSGMPERMREKGSGGAEAQVRWRIARETDRRPEVYTNLEVELPDHEEKVLIGHQGWDVGLGLGMVKGFRWGTIAARASIAYNLDEREVTLGEYALEYSRRLSESLRVSGAIVGDNRDLATLANVQWRIRPGAYARIDLGLGLTREAADIASRVGVLFAF